MSDMKNVEARCLCGAVEVQVARMDDRVSVCHCSMCRRWGGAPHMALDCGTEVVVRGAEIGIYRSSEWAERGFCRNCGTHLFYRLTATGQYHMPAGLFQVDAPLSLSQQIFIDDKPDFYSFAQETVNMTGEEVFAQFMSKEEKENDGSR